MHGRTLLFDFSSAFNTIHPSLLQEKLNIMAVDPYLVNWITDYLTNRSRFVRVGGVQVLHTDLQHWSTSGYGAVALLDNFIF